MLPTRSALLGVERLEARGLVGTARSSPQPPLAVARRARLEVVGPTRQHRTKRYNYSVCALSDHADASEHCRIHRSLRGPSSVWPQHRVRSWRRHVPNAVCRYAAAEGMTRSPALVPAGTAVRRGQRRIWFFRMLIIMLQLVRTGTPSCRATCCGVPRRACARQRRATFVSQSARTRRGPRGKVGTAAWSAEA